MTFSPMLLEPPDFASKRSRLADWIEIQVLVSPRGRVSSASIKTLLRVATDDRTLASDLDPDADSNGDPEVTDRASEDLEERVAEELEYRARSVGDSYPFVLAPTAGGRSVFLRVKDDWASPARGCLVYVFCLLESGIREGLISKPKDAKPLVDAIGNIFQICSCIAIGGYTGFDVSSFGFPRSTGDAFLPALQEVWRRYGNYSIKKAIPHGFDDKLKDGGIDVIAWRSFDDGHSATLLLFAQVASGADWKSKAVAEDVRGVRGWFDGVQFEYFTPAICIPFPLWSDLDEPAEDTVTGRKLPFLDGVKRRFAFRENKFGVIFDRGRIARSCNIALAPDYTRKAAIDGIDRICEVSNWVDQVVHRMREAA